MKKLFALTVIVYFLLMAGIAGADEWHATNQVTVRWDAVTTLLDGSPVPEGDIVAYDLYIRPIQTGIPFMAVPNVSGTESLITLLEEGDYHVGVRAVRIVPAVGEIPARAFYSSISWSSDPLAVKDGVTFGVSHYIPMARVGGLEI